MEQLSLWGKEFDIKEADVKKVLKKIKQPKVVKEMTTEQLLNSKRVPVERKMEVIESEVNRILGKFKENTVVIEDYDSFTNYIDACIQNGIISIDTETNNSLNTFDCKLMGLCLYTPGQKHAYIPVNHTTMDGERLSWQLTELCIKEQLKRCSDLFKVFHNAVFDIEVIKQTCGIKLYADWDTQVGAVLLNENEKKGLKVQYKLHIDPEQEKYSIEHLFGKLPYAIFDPKLFALYAATDAYETYRLYEYQRAEFKKPGMEDVYKLFQEIEIPILDVVVDMELEGVEIDTEYAKKLSKVYHEKADAVQVKIDEELKKLKPQIDAWRRTPEANKQTTNENGKVGKSLNQKLSDPPNLSSPEQVKILLYDVMNVPVVSQDGKKTTGKDVLKELSDIYPICAYLAEKKGYDKLLESFIDNLPALVQKDGRLHARFNSTGTATGRFSSDKPNLQNIPSKAKDVRMMFRAPIINKQVECTNNCYIVSKLDEVQTELDKWVRVSELQIGDKLLTSDNTYDYITRIEQVEDNYYLYISSWTA